MKRSTSLRLIITGATGMDGEGVLHEALRHPDVAEILMINRRTANLRHPKLREILHDDFQDLTPVASELAGYNACFFCLGVSSVGMSAERYYSLTYSLTLHIGRLLADLNPQMSFGYISGAGTDGTGRGRSRWARVKGKTANDLMQLGFRQVNCFRPGFIKPIPGLLHAHAFYKYINWLFPVGRRLFPKAFCTLQELAAAMIHAVYVPARRQVVEGRQIIAFAKAETQRTTQ